MKISVNLATRPFVELRPFFLRLRLLIAGLAVVSLGLGVAGHMLGIKLAKAQEQMDALRYRTIAAQQEKLHAEQSMRLPVNEAVLERAHFLNRLFLAKSFSWTAVMMDLETVLPTGVQVTSIEPQVTADGDVVIRLKVSGERDRAIELVRNLEHSRRFIQPRLTGESTLAKETGPNGQPIAVNPNMPVGTEFDILAHYNPLPENEPYRYTKAKAEVAASSQPAPMAAGGVRSMPARPKPANSRYPRYGVTLPPAPVKNGGPTR